MDTTWETEAVEGTKMDREPVVEGPLLPAQPLLPSVLLTGLRNVCPIRAMFAIWGNQKSITHKFAKSMSISN